MKSKVYFAASGGRIKVGTTGQAVRDRLTAIGSHLAEPLELIGYIDGGLPLERAVQKHLHQWNIKGEWFCDCHEVRTVLKRLILQGPSAIGFDVSNIAPSRGTSSSAPRKRDPEMFGRCARFIWGETVELELRAMSNESDPSIIAGWLNGSIRPPRLIRVAVGAAVASYAIGEGMSFLGDPDEIIRFPLADEGS